MYSHIKFVLICYLACLHRFASKDDDNSTYPNIITKWNLRKWELLYQHQTLLRLCVIVQTCGKVTNRNSFGSTSNNCSRYTSRISRERKALSPTPNSCYTCPKTCQSDRVAPRKLKRPQSPVKEIRVHSQLCASRNGWFARHCTSCPGHWHPQKLSRIQRSAFSHSNPSWQLSTRSHDWSLGLWD